MPLMTIFEPLFLLLVLTTVITLVGAGVAALRGRRTGAVRALKRLGVGAVIYMAVVLTASMASPRRTYHVGDLRCFDDWCITVTKAARPSPTSVVVDLELSSRAKRVSQRELGTVVYLTDSAGHRYDPVADASQPPLDARLEPGQAIATRRTFAVGANARRLALAYTHEGGFPIGFFIIGENEWAHGPPLVPLDSAGTN